MNNARVQHAWRKEHHEPGRRLRTMNCVPTTPATNPTTVFASPPMPMMPLDKTSCSSPAKVPASSPVTGPTTRRVDHHDQHQIDAAAAADQSRARVV